MRRSRPPMQPSLLALCHCVPGGDQTGLIAAAFASIRHFHCVAGTYLNLVGTLVYEGIFNRDDIALLIDTFEPQFGLSPACLEFRRGAAFSIARLALCWNWAASKPEQRRTGRQKKAGVSPNADMADTNPRPPNGSLPSWPERNARLEYARLQ